MTGALEGNDIDPGGNASQRDKADSFNAKTNLAYAGFRKRKVVELENLGGADLVKANYLYSLCCHVIASRLTIISRWVVWRSKVS